MNHYGTCKDCGVYVEAPRKYCPPCRKTHIFIPSYKHGLYNTSTYKMWTSIRYRCRHEDIDIDPRWNDFAIFLSDVGEQPEDMSIQRIDKNKGYYKDNCEYRIKNNLSRLKKRTE